VQALEARLETLKRILPPEKEMPDLMRSVDNYLDMRLDPNSPIR
jgi:Tfp pilus assembly protein PilO